MELREINKDYSCETFKLFICEVSLEMRRVLVPNLRVH
jgi:hypothetical protein